MFDSLLGGKFSSKCKHSIKCIKCRIAPIRKKKEATVSYLKKVVAELLAKHDDANAFGRIGALVVEINHTSCYEMIEQYCECILKLLSTLQKQRECPEEATEAAATLIFAAARFSDLPELCDLRRAFTERYASHMESYVNAEFVEKMQKKSFPRDKKLQVMHAIAKEFSVEWDPKGFQQKKSDPPPAPALDQPEEAMPTSNGNYGFPQMEINGRKEEAVINAAKVEVPSKGPRESSPRIIMHKQQVQPEPRDIHVIPSSRNGRSRDLAEKTRKVAAVDEPENVEPDYAYTGTLPYVKSKSSRNSAQKDVRLNEDIIRSVPPRAPEGLGLVGLEKQAVGPAVSRDVKAANMVPPYAKSNGVRAEAGAQERQSGDFVHEEMPKRAKEGLNPVGPAVSRGDFVHEEMPKRAKEGLNPVGPAVSRDVKAANMIPPYAKSNGIRAEIGAEERQSGDFVHEEMPKTAEEGLNPIGQEGNFLRPANSNGGRAFNMLNPPYTKPKFKSPSSLSEHNKPIDELAIRSSNADRSNGGLDKDHQKDEVIAEERPRPVSVRRKHPKPPMAGEVNNVPDDIKLAAQTQSGRSKVGRRSSATYDDDYGEEEMIADQYHKQAAISERNGIANHEQHMAGTSSGRRPGGVQSTTAYDDGHGEAVNIRYHKQAEIDEMNGVVHHDRLMARTSSGRGKVGRRSFATYDDGYREEEKIVYQKQKEIDEMNGVEHHDQLMARTSSGRSKGARWSSATYDDGYREEEKIVNRHDMQPTSNKMNGAAYHEQHMTRTPTSRRRHGSRRYTSASYDGDYDEEEAVMDRLLIHLSKKGARDESNKARSRMRPPPVDLGVDPSRLVEDHWHHHHQHGNGRIHDDTEEPVAYPPKRAISLPPEPPSPSDTAVAVKVPARATSMQPDILSPNGGRVHPRLPDYDELAAQFMALKKG